jgi:hypothetical protein
MQQEFRRCRVRIRRSFPAACFAALLFSVPASAQTSLTGTWSGTYTFSIQLSACQNKTFTSSGNVAVTFLQTGTSLVGRADLTNALVFGGTCNPGNGEVAHVLLGTVGTTGITWHYPNNPNGTQFSGTVDGNTIAAQISDFNGGSGSLTMTRTSADAPAVDLTGTWTGNSSLSDICPNGAKTSYTGPFTLALVQSGNSAAGVVTMENVPLYDQNCATIANLTMSMAAAGVVSGSTFTGAVFDPWGSFDFPISATISNAGMSGTVTGVSQTSTAGTFTLTRSSTQPPASDFAGSYDGSYNETDNETFTCLNIGSLSYSGNASVSIVQAGNAVSGSLIFESALDVSSDGFGNCVVVDVGEEVLPLYGNLSGNTLTLQLPLGNGATNVFTFNFNGDTITGTLTDSFGDLAQFTTTKSASAAPPTINTFGASPASIVSGQQATLSWSASNATAVSIDNGVGSQPLSGSVAVSPAQTTVYTLTATSPVGSVTAQTTVTVSPPGPRRRAARP